MLTTAEVAALRQTHRQMRTRTADAYRLNAIILLGTGWTQQAVSEALLLDDRTLRRYVAAYRQAGSTACLNHTVAAASADSMMISKRGLSPVY